MIGRPRTTRLTGQPRRTRRARRLCRNEIEASRDFTQGGGVGEVGNKKGVESDAKTPVKSGVLGGTSRLHPTPLKGVKSMGEVGLSLHERILLFIAESPRKSSEITGFLGVSRVYGNLVRRLNTLLDDKLIALTIPGKPRSRLQKYRITAKGEQLARRIREGIVGGAQ